jgi:HSP20 family protein
VGSVPAIFIFLIIKNKGGTNMSTRTLTKSDGNIPVLFDDFFKPWNEWFDRGSLINKMLTVPAVNIIESKDEFKLSLAIPGMKKEDFKIDIDGGMLTISSEKEESKEDREHRFTRKEYNYSSFTRSFSLPEEVSKEKIQANYNDGVLYVLLPKKEEAKNGTHKSISVR